VIVYLPIEDEDHEALLEIPGQPGRYHLCPYDEAPRAAP
jgi:hypothetical protein